MKNTIEALRHIREKKGNASTRTIMELFNVTEDEANELIEYFYEEGYIHEPKRMCDGNRILLKITSTGLNLITKLK